MLCLSVPFNGYFKNELICWIFLLFISQTQLPETAIGRNRQTTLSVHFLVARLFHSSFEIVFSPQHPDLTSPVDKAYAGFYFNPGA